MTDVELPRSSGEKATGHAHAAPSRHAPLSFRIQTRRTGVSRLRKMVLTGEQLAAAMALIRIGPGELAALAEVSPRTIGRLERRCGSLASSLPEAEALQAALEQAGVDFIASGEDRSEGAGVRLRKGPVGATIETADLNGSNDG
jgi:hypothetical protein